MTAITARYHQHAVIFDVHAAVRMVLARQVGSYEADMDTLAEELEGTRGALLDAEAKVCPCSAFDSNAVSQQQRGSKAGLNQFTVWLWCGNLVQDALCHLCVML